MKFKSYKLYELANWYNGLAFKNITFTKIGVPVIKIAELKNGITGQTKFTQDVFDDLYRLHNGDMLFSWSGNPWTSIDVFRYSLQDGWLNQHIFKVIPKENIIKNDYMFYLLKNNMFNFMKIASQKQTTGLGHITVADLKKYDVEVPNIKTQNKVINILKPIDEKIKLNNKINNNLLEIGVSLVNKYFNEMEDCKTLGNIIKFNKGKKPKDISEAKIDGYDKYLTIACLNGQELNYAVSSKTVIANNDLLMVMDGASSGDVYYSDYGIVGSTLAKLDIIDENTENEYIYFCLKKYNNLIKSKNTGSAIPHTDKVFVYSLEIPKIGKEKQQYFKTLLKNIQENEKENRTLEQLRDTLLPKLMNGEIDLDNIEI